MVARTGALWIFAENHPVIQSEYPTRRITNLALNYLVEGSVSVITTSFSCMHDFLDSKLLSMVNMEIRLPN